MNNRALKPLISLSCFVALAACGGGSGGSGSPSAQPTPPTGNPPPANSAPTWGSDPFTVSSALSASYYINTIVGEATDVDADPLTYSKDFGPAWLNVTITGDIYGTATAGDEL